MRAAAVIIGNAIVWGAVIIGCSLALKGTGAHQQIQNILAVGALASLVIVAAGVLPFGRGKGRAGGSAPQEG